MLYQQYVAVQRYVKIAVNKPSLPLLFLRSAAAVAVVAAAVAVLGRLAYIYTAYAAWRGFSVVQRHADHSRRIKLFVERSGIGCQHRLSATIATSRHTSYLSQYSLSS